MIHAAYQSTIYTSLSEKKKQKIIFIRTILHWYTSNENNDNNKLYEFTNNDI